MTQPPIDSKKAVVHDISTGLNVEISPSASIPTIPSTMESKEVNNLSKVHSPRFELNAFDREIEKLVERTCSHSGDAFWKWKLKSFLRPDSAKKDEVCLMDDQCIILFDKYPKVCLVHVV